MTVTPMMSQWHSCKEEAKEALLLFRLGDFYEAFYDDAVTISKTLGLTLTARQGVPMCGVPFHTADGYIDKLVAKGFKIAIAEQTEDPKAAKGLVRREIVRIVTPGTLINSQLLADKRNNFFVCIAEHDATFGLAILDLTTTEFRVLELAQQTQLIDELCRLRPAEMLVSQDLHFLKDLSHVFPFIATLRKPLDPSLSFEVLTAHFDVQNLDGFGLRNKKAAIVAAGSLLLYLKEELNLSLEHITTIQPSSLSQFMSLDRSTLRNLDLDTLLLDLLDDTKTAMGGRLLKQWLQYPLLSVSQIQERQQAVFSFIEKSQISEKARHLLSHVRDLERLMMKISAKYATPRDLFALGVSLSYLPAIKETLSEHALFDAQPLSQKILSALSETPPLRIGDGEIFKDGYHSELDHLRQLSKDSLSWMARYQNTLREETGIKTLKVSYTKAFGYYIEVSRAQSDRIPSHFQRRQTLVNAERFITEELKQFEHQVLTAEDRACAIEVQLFESLRTDIAAHASAVNHAAKILARIDVLLSFAYVATHHRWVCPIIDESDALDIVEGRHPVIEQSIGRASFIPNDTHLNAQTQLMLITGPNMAGKSTYIRQVALIAILAQMGSYVPAASARIGIIDKVFSRIGASDDLARGQSTFMVEMSETANILNNATSRSLVLLDEIGRGTSTYDGISIAWAVAEYLLTTHRKQAKTLFATHYWELTQLETDYPHAANFQTAIQETPSGIVFLRKIIQGGTDKSYGIHVAKLAGLPPKAIKRAEEMLQELAKKEQKQLALFISTPQEHPALTDLRTLDITAMSPLQAYHKLCELKKHAL